MPKIGILRLISSFIVGNITFIVASGSPGPLDKKIPFGLLFKISFTELADLLRGDLETFFLF